MSSVVGHKMFVYKKSLLLLVARCSFIKKSSVVGRKMSQNDQTEPLLDSNATNINNINRDNFHIPSPDTNTSRQIPHKFNNNKNNPNVAGTQLLPSTSVAVVRTSLPSQQSSLQTIPSVEAPLSYQFIDTANDMNNFHVPSPNIFVTHQVPQNNNNKNNHVNNYTDVNEFLWNSNERGPREFHFTGSSGVKNISDDTSCPLSVFKTFLTDD